MKKSFKILFCFTHNILYILFGVTFVFYLLYHLWFLKIYISKTCYIIGIISSNISLAIFIGIFLFILTSRLPILKNFMRYKKIYCEILIEYQIEYSTLCNIIFNKDDYLLDERNVKNIFSTRWQGKSMVQILDSSTGILRDEHNQPVPQLCNLDILYHSMSRINKSLSGILTMNRGIYINEIFSAINELSTSKFFTEIQNLRNHYIKNPKMTDYVNNKFLILLKNYFFEYYTLNKTLLNDFQTLIKD